VTDRQTDRCVSQYTAVFNPLTPELNPSAQGFLPRVFIGILIFKGMTVRRPYKSFGVKGLMVVTLRYVLIRVRPDFRYPCHGLISVHFSKSRLSVLFCSAGLYNRQRSVISV
jgi:hypothetical protein